MNQEFSQNGKDVEFEAAINWITEFHIKKPGIRQVWVEASRFASTAKVEVEVTGPDGKLVPSQWWPTSIGPTPALSASGTLKGDCAIRRYVLGS